MLKPGYLPFYFRARRWNRAALARGERFDLAHQPVPVALRYPSPVSWIGHPLVMGPVGGSLPSPHGFHAEESTTAWYVGLRGLDRLRLRRDPWLRRTYQQASCVIGIAPYVGDLLAGTSVQRFEVVSDTGIEQLPEPVDRTGRRGEVPAALVVRLVRTKGARDAIRALGLVRDLPASLDIAGDGFDRTACEALASELGLTGRVRFHGWLPRPQIEELYRSADVFVFPSYREPGGTVTFEAMGHGLPVSSATAAGRGTAVHETCGIRVHPVSPEQYARDLAYAVARLVRDPGLRAALGEGARQRGSRRSASGSPGHPGQIEPVYAGVLAEERGRDPAASFRGRALGGRCYPRRCPTRRRQVRRH